MTRTPDNDFSRVGKESIVRDPSSQNALTASEIAYNSTSTIADKIQILETSIVGSGTGDMSRIIYDTNNSGVVDNSEKLDGETKVQLRDRSSHTGTQSADTITNGTTNGAFLLTERTKLASVETNADVTDEENVTSVLNSLAVKTTNGSSTDSLPLIVGGVATRFSLDKLATTLGNTLIASMGLIGSNIGNTPSGTVSATTVQAAINELDNEKTSVAGVNTILSSGGYYKSGGTDVAVSDGGTGTSSFNANGVIIGGTTTAAPLNSIPAPTSTRMVLTGNVSGAPSFQEYKRGTIYTGTTEISAGGYTGVGYPILSVTIPGGAIGTGKGIHIKGTYITHPFGFTDYRDDSFIRISLGGTVICQNIIGPRISSQADFYGDFEMMITGTSISSQKNIMSSFTRGGPPAQYGKNDITRSDTSINTGGDLTLDIYFGFEFSNVNCYSRLSSIIIKEI